MMTKDKLRQLSGDERLGQMRDSEYLGAEDIDDGTEPILTIAGLWYGSVTLQRGKENKDVLSFAEERVPGIYQVRPLIVNSTNRKTLRKLFGDAKASTLVGKQIQLYVDHNVRDPQDGGMTDGIRIRPYKPRPPKQEPVPPCADCEARSFPQWGETPAGSPHTRKSTTAFRSVRNARRSARTQRPQPRRRRKSSRSHLKKLRPRLRRCRNGPSCGYAGELLFSGNEHGLYGLHTVQSL